MINFQNKNEFLLDKIEERAQTTSTLLIPDALFDDFKKELGLWDDDLALYLRVILQRYRILTHSGLIPEPVKIKTEYQNKEQNLKRVGFRPFNRDWLELGSIALAYGKSRCWLFVYLLKMDIIGLWRLLRKAGLQSASAVPTLPSLELRSFWILRRVQQNFARGYHVKI